LFRFIVFSFVCWESRVSAILRKCFPDVLRYTALGERRFYEIVL
jgi:hypothetical protein